jgi:hypothetical protein
METGSCYCGAVAAQLSGEPFWICYDHDDDCRRAIGSPLNIWVGYRPAEFRLIRGVPKAFSRTKGVTRTFCADCGTSISYADQGLLNELYVTIGFLDSPENFPPQAHAYWRKKLPWVELLDNLPRINTYSRGRDESFGKPRSRKGPERR